MRTKFKIRFSIVAIILIAITYLIHAASVGQIKGKLTDKETGAPIIGASVAVIGTTSGAMTDFEGKFIIARLQPGTYTLKFSHLDYVTVEMTEVEVKADCTFEINQALEKNVIEIGKTISVRSEREVIDRFQVSNEVVMGAAEIKAKPVTSVDELLAQVAGVSQSPTGEIFIRGGNAGKVAIIVDGVPIGDPLGGLGMAGASLNLASGTPPPAHGGNAIVNGEPFDAMFFKNYGVNPFVDTEDDHLSTFAIDVDDASFTLARAYLGRGALPNNDGVRTEEFINHFEYDYPVPEDKAFSIFVDGAPSVFGQNCQLMRIGIQGFKINDKDRKPANLTFVVDVSGSMDRENRLSLVIKALVLLVDQLTPADKIGIVTYGSYAREILQPTSIVNRDAIMASMVSLMPGGSTNAEEGIRLGYKMADRNFEQGHINRVILCSDGVANVGQTGPDQLLADIKQFADKGITLSTIGFGMGNYNDVLMEKLGDKGNGHYSYVDNIDQARRIFVENLTGTLQVIARDVKIQVDFDPKIVRSYRLLGYENRDVEDAKFRDDKEDGGEIGSGHQVTALYEIKLLDGAESNQLGTVYVRYKDPDTKAVTEVTQAIRQDRFVKNFRAAGNDLKLAVAAAEFAEILRQSYWAKGSKLKDVLSLAKEISTRNDSSELIELMSMIDKAQRFDEQLTVR